MKIAMMTNNYLPFIGGVPISIQRLSDGLRMAGHQVTVFAPEYSGQTDTGQSDSEWLNSERSDSIKTDREKSVSAESDRKQSESCDMIRYRALIKGIVNGASVPDCFDRRIEQEFARGGFDVIHVHHPMMIGWTAA